MHRRPTALALVPLVAILAGLLALAGTAEAKQQGKKQKRGIVTRTAFGTVAGNFAILSATATCPKRSRAVGGGFAVPAPRTGYSPLVFESQKVGQRGWRASAQMGQDAPFDPITIAVDVYCRRGAPKTATVASTVPTVDASAFHLNGPATSASCPSNRRLTGGGFSTPPPLSSIGAANSMRRSEPTGNSWTSEVESDNAPSSLTSYAYCARRKASPPMPAVAATASGANPAPASTSVTATCTSKAHDGRRRLPADVHPVRGGRRLQHLRVTSRRQVVDGRRGPGWNLDRDLVQLGRPLRPRSKRAPAQPSVAQRKRWSE